jgi:GT2 family glycosyltransferase
VNHIIVPVADTNERCKGYLDNLLTSIRAGGYYQNNYHTILAFDNCSEDFQNYFKEKYKGDFIVAIDNRNPKNLNFCRNANSGLRIAYQAAVSTGDIDANFIILNMDTILPHSMMLDIVLGEGLSFPTPVDNPELMKVSSIMSDKNPNIRTPVTKFSGFCMCLSYKLVEKIGMMDEHFPGSFNDDDACVRALLAGFPVEVVSVDVHHEIKDRAEPSNTGAYDHAELGLGLQKFRRKWSIPHYIQHEQFNNWIVDNHTWNEAMRCQ